MNKKALFGILIALIIPLVAYLVMRTVNTVTPPQRIFFDSVSTKISKGKEITDTVWSRVPDFSLTNQMGQKVSWKDLMYQKNDSTIDGKIVVIDFFFTHCPTICPTMTRNMKLLRDNIKSNNLVGDREANFVHFLSVSVDPERDSVPELKKWADRFQINPENWWLLTGNKKEIYDWARNDLKLAIVDGGNVDTSFMHPQLFMLLDKDRVIRARRDESGNVKMYNGLDSADLKNLAEDIILLSLEKDPKKKSPLAGKLELIAIVFAAAGVGIVLLVLFMKKENRRT
ncbi:MAG TPA: SCO family protein [Flavisolibacter sp.]|nr:SCO family protein [Flavisolibacter sp.]